MTSDDRALRKFLLESGLVSKKDLDDIPNNKSLEEVLVSSGLIKEDDFRRARAYVLGIPFVDLKGEKIDEAILRLIPEPIARRHNLIAWRKSDRGLEVAMLDPEDLTAIDFLKKSLDVKILPRLTDSNSIKNALLSYQKSLKQEFGNILSQESSILGEKLGQAQGELDPVKLAEDLPVVRIVDTLLSHAYLQKASDIHIEPYEKEVIVRYRIDGILRDAMSLPPVASSGISARLKALAGLRLDEKRLPQDGRFRFEVSGEKISIRLSVMPTFYGEKAVLRLLPDSGRGLSLEDVGFRGENLERLHRAIRETTGLILVTGPTGSGKSTTLYALLEMLNTPDVNIATIEDPIEYQMPRISQTQVKPEIGLTFAQGLRTLVRQDPDIIMVGEIRDAETASLAINAALTGHLVLSTLHTNSAGGAIPRLLDMGIAPFLLASTLRLVVGQRLVRTLAGETENYSPTEKDLKEIKKQVDEKRLLSLVKEEGLEIKSLDKAIFKHPKPSENYPDGYSGRKSINEALVMSGNLRQLCSKKAGVKEIEEMARAEGMVSMVEDGLIKALLGETSLKEVWRAVFE